MSRAVWLADILSDAGLTVRPVLGWQSRGGNDFTPKGIILHHTVTSPTRPDSEVDRMLAITGSTTTPPPLCNYSTNRDGTISIIAAGTANHGGAGSWNGVAGNRHWFGDEMKNRGTSAEPWPGRQLESAYVAAAAILNHLGADSSMVCGHKEYATPPGRKVDPHSLNMTTVRRTVADIMENHMPHKHTPMPAELPRDWADQTWKEWVEASGTDPKSRTWTFYREDLSWVYSRVIRPMEARIAALETRVRALERTGGGVGDGLNSEQVKAIINQAVVHVD